jgi:hypothetical protein
MSETDRRLKDHLDSNQLKRERMCLEILKVQQDYSDISPRLPNGGPDGGRDIQGMYKDYLCFGAVGFVNGASDAKQHRDQIGKKFKDDLESALTTKKDGSPSPKSFVFFTNVALTPTIKGTLQRQAYSMGISHCDIFDREQIRIILDSNRGYAIRYRYLDIALSDAEQKDFFSAWADEINAAIGSGMSAIDQTTKRVQFLLEAQLPLNHLSAIVKLDASIWDVCKGEFFFQTMLTLRVHSDGFIGITFGGGTKEISETLEEWESRGKSHPQNGQYGFGFSWLFPDTPQYARYAERVKNIEHPKNIGKQERLDYVRTAWSQGILAFDQKQLNFSPLMEPFLERYQPTCKLLELDRSMLLFDCSREIADHLVEIVILGGGYELLRLSKTDIHVEQGSYQRLKVPMEGKQEESSHEWTTLRPSTFSSCFTIDLTGRTPKRYDW